MKFAQAITAAAALALVGSATEIAAETEQAYIPHQQEAMYRPEPVGYQGVQEGLYMGQHAPIRHAQVPVRSAPYNGPELKEAPYRGPEPKGAPYMGAELKDAPYNGPERKGSPYRGPEPKGSPYRGAEQKSSPYMGASGSGNKYGDVSANGCSHPETKYLDTEEYQAQSAFCKLQQVWGRVK